MFPIDVLSAIFEYDSTYREIMTRILRGNEIKYKLWNLWKNRLFLCNKFIIDPTFRKKMEFILDYHFENCAAAADGENFPENIEVYCGGKMFYYSDQKESTEHAFEIFRDRDFSFTRNRIEITFTYSDGTKTSIDGQVFTRDQYYNTFINVDEDIYTDLYCFHNNRELYLLQHYSEFVNI